MRVHAFIVLVSLLSTLISDHALAVELSIEGYLEQVEGSHPSLQAAREASAGAELRTTEASLITTPRLFADAQWINDHETNALFTVYRKFRQDNYNLGVMQQTSFGLSTKIYYNLMNIDYVGFRPRFWEGSPRLELSQSLWRNFLGRETRAQVEVTEASARSTRFLNSFQARRIRSDAEMAYVRVAAAQSVVELNQQSLKRAQDLLDWSTRRVRLNLGDESDNLQARANFETRKLQLQSSQDQLRTAVRAFNQLRHLNSDELSEKLALPEIPSLKIPGRVQVREDVQASIEQTRISAANARLGTERNRPNLEVYGQYAWNSRAGDEVTAFRRSLENDIPTYVFGFRFNTPLAFGRMNDAQEGYQKEAAASEKLKDQRIFEQEVQWKDLVQRFEAARRRYEIAVGLVEIQKLKVLHERTRLSRGRTTTYQTLIFELDFTQAELSRIQTQGEILELLAQMKLFGNGAS